MEDNFQSWAYVELMGHNKIAGFVSELKLGNNSMIRVDVPAVNDIPKFSKVFNTSAIYAITPVTEETALDMAKKIKAKPLDVWDMQQIFESKIQEMVTNGSLLKPQLAEASDDFDEIDDKIGF